MLDLIDYKILYNLKITGKDLLLYYDNCKVE